MRNTRSKIGCPHHGMADENTSRAAAEMGITYVESRFRATDTIVPNGVRSRRRICGCWCPADSPMGPRLYRSPPLYWAAASEEAFSPTNARQKWIDNLDWAKRNGLMAGLVIHPWMLVVNPGEVQVVKDCNPLR